MSYETIPTTPENEFEALAPVYLEIFQSLGTETLKFAFYSMDPFEEYGANLRLRRMMQEQDEDAKQWAHQEKINYRNMQREKETRKVDDLLSARADIRLEDLVIQDSSGRHQFIPGGAEQVVQAFGNRWFWHPTLHDITADHGTIVDYLLLQNFGACSRTIRLDPETNKLAFGDEMHSFRYDRSTQELFGSLGSGSFRLDEIGRFTDLSEKEKHEMRYSHLFY